MLLDTINTPRDIRELTPAQLAKLADEIRELIVRTVSKTGGHLSSNLGVVELTLALHYVFNTPVDKIIWDVGHQCYTHKILTERKDRFCTIRQNGGLSRLPLQEGELYDAFDTGHATNSISIATGLAEAKKKQNQDHRILAVIGDGSLTGGMSFEALNHAGHLKSDIIVILNDNEMSISKNVGALSAHLNRIMTGEFMSSLREDIKQTIRNLPAFGDKVYKAARYFEEAVKGFVTPGLLFEELGFQYVGPVDGHNLNHLILNLQRQEAQRADPRPRRDQEGEGIRARRKGPRPVPRHLPVRRRTGEALHNGKPTYTDVFGETLIQLARRTRGSSPSRPPWGSARASKSSRSVSPAASTTSASRGARHHLCRRPRPGGLQALRGHVLHVPSAGLRPDHRGRLPPAAARRLRHRQERHRRGRTAPRITAVSTCPTCATSRTWSS